VNVASGLSVPVTSASIRVAWAVPTLPNVPDSRAVKSTIGLNGELLRAGKVEWWNGSGPSGPGHAPDADVTAPQRLHLWLF
jgi:hypothetical protein